MAGSACCAATDPPAITPLAQGRPRPGTGRADAPPELTAVEAKGRYRGPGVSDGFVKTTLTLRFGSTLRSLSREDVNAWRDAAARRLHALPGARVDGVKEKA